jgi:hypothetical protein
MFLKTWDRVSLKDFSKLPEKIRASKVENLSLSTEFEVSEEDYIEYSLLKERLGSLEKTFFGKRFLSREMNSSGPWNFEPDFAEWLDPETLYPCVAVRHPAGFWTVSVGLPEGHQLFEVPGDEIDLQVESWGGITRSSLSKPRSSHRVKRRNLLEVLFENFQHEERIWWVGMDFGHSFDYIPNPLKPKRINCLRDCIQAVEFELSRRQSAKPQDYRTLDFVMNECSSLAEQLYQLDLSLS